jgi:hypothetical protein
MDSIAYTVCSLTLTLFAPSAGDGYRDLWDSLRKDDDWHTTIPMPAVK